MEEANLVLPMMSRADDFVDKISGSVDETEEFPERVSTYLDAKLNWSRLVADGGESGSTGWVFWDRQDDRPNTLPVSDFESVDIISPKVKDKIRLALGRIPLHPRYGQSLVQFWATTKIEGRTLLTTQNQPFALGKMGRSTWGLCEYRMKSIYHKFYGDIGERGEEELGLPGRVFLHNFPESAPDVQYYSLKEYPHRDDAFRCQVRASWALPVFDLNRVCVGVLELVSANNAITDWRDESFLDNLHSALQDQGLLSFNVYIHGETKDENKALTTALHELSLALESVYKRHKLPLALAWVPCNDCDRLLVGRCLFEDGEYLGAFKANDDHLINFLVTSTGYHLWKGHLAEMVTGSTSMLYCSDITQVSIAEYPLVPFARQCKLTGWFTICLKSSCTGDYVYILEFFLPTISKDNEDMTTISTILGTLKANSKTFKLASGKELGEELSVSVLGQRQPQDINKEEVFPLVVPKVGDTVHLDSPEELEFDATLNEPHDVGSDLCWPSRSSSVADHINSEEGPITTQKRKKENTGVPIEISLDYTRQCSKMRLENAARELNVSSPALKRICGDYGIYRGPPCNIDKVGAPQPSRDVPLCTIDKVAAPQPSRDVPACNVDKVGTPQPWHVALQEGISQSLQEGISQLTSDMPSNQASDGSDYLTHLGPPQNINKVGSSRPLSVEQQEGTSKSSQLTSDMPFNQASASVAHIKPHDAAFKEMKTVMIKVKYFEFTMKFSLPMSSGVQELNQQVAKRLPAEAQNYICTYEDGDGDSVMIACDEDLHGCISFSEERGKKIVLIEIKRRPE